MPAVFKICVIEKISASDVSALFTVRSNIATVRLLVDDVICEKYNRQNEKYSFLKRKVHIF